MVLAEEKERAIMSVTRAIEDDSASVMAVGRQSRPLVSGALARDAFGAMSQSRITLLLVLADLIGGQVVGLVHIHDVLRQGVA
ncbi:hypothetical protein [Sphingobium aquiterrae]|uniref:hypothetical protein n=1 Tax=Sphingobium TaxID=165695 RepID=UPI0030170061